MLNLKIFEANSTMVIEKVDTLVIGGGQAGLAMSEHLSGMGIEHLILEKSRIAERWRTSRWDSLVANGPSWHDRFPSKEFSCSGPDEFPTKGSVVKYFEEFANQIKAPIRCGVKVNAVHMLEDEAGFRIETSEGTIEAKNVVAATGPFQVPVIPPVVPDTPSITQIHSTSYDNPNNLPAGAVLVVGAGSSGSQIADELLRSGRKVYLSVGPHDRPPRRYRGKDFVWWLGALGKWQMKTPAAGKEHVTIAVSGAHGGSTVDFREFASRGMNLVGRTQSYKDGMIFFGSDLAGNIAEGDANYLSVLEEADAYIEKNNLDMPEENEVKIIGPDPECITNPILELSLPTENITTIIWATGFAQDFGWLNVDTFDKNGTPQHDRGVSNVPGIYFLGLPWLSMRGSSFIWGVWEDAKYLASYISKRSGS
jgi:putative flavoprotein involved in K+ transport